MKKILHCALLLLFISCSQNKKNTLTVFHAGSLSYPVKELKSNFLVQHPHDQILTENVGSLECIRKITDLQKPCDLFLSADYRVIEDRLIPQFASWNLIFATNEMVVAYNPQSKYANEIKEDNWWEILARPDVEIGRSDPGMDPCGYHTVIVTKLADEQFAQKVLSRSEKNIRAKEVDLLTMLESHALDYLFIYKSVAQQHRLPYITLPKEINLGYPEYDYSYKTAYAVIAGKKPCTTDTIYGEPIYYSLTIPTHAQNPVLAQQFVDFITSEKGQYIITQKAKLTAIKPFFSEKSKNKK